MKKNTIVLLIILLLISSIVIVFYLSKRNVTGEIVEEETYSYTKAICNESNYCQDYEIKCKDKEVIEMKPITGALVQNPQDWEDPRDNETDNLCE